MTFDDIEWVVKHFHMKPKETEIYGDYDGRVCIKSKDNLIKLLETDTHIKVIRIYNDPSDEFSFTSSLFFDYRRQFHG